MIQEGGSASQKSSQAAQRILVEHADEAEDIFATMKKLELDETNRQKYGLRETNREGSTLTSEQIGDNVRDLHRRYNDLKGDDVAEGVAKDMLKYNDDVLEVPKVAGKGELGPDAQGLSSNGWVGRESTSSSVESGTLFDNIYNRIDEKNGAFLKYKNGDGQVGGFARRELYLDVRNRIEEATDEFIRGVAAQYRADREAAGLPYRFDRIVFFRGGTNRLVFE